MKGRSGRSYGGRCDTGVGGSLAVAAEVETATISSSPPIISSANQQTDQGNNAGENGRSESASTAQISTQVSSGGGAQPSTPRTPNSPPEPNGANTPNPPTPGNTNSNNSTLVDPSPQYVTITAEEADSRSVRSYASLTPVDSSMVDGDAVGGDAVPENASYVTYVEGSDHTSLYAAAAAAAAAANGQTMSYPVYTVGDSTSAIYSPGSTTQYYTTTTNPSTPTVAYTQESGVTYLVPTTNNNNSISLESADGQHNISHANRVSPATSMKSQRNITSKFVNHRSPVQHIDYPPAKIRRISLPTTTNKRQQSSTIILDSSSSAGSDDDDDGHSSPLSTNQSLPFNLKFPPILNNNINPTSTINNSHSSSSSNKNNRFVSQSSCKDRQMNGSRIVPSSTSCSPASLSRLAEMDIFRIATGSDSSHLDYGMPSVAKFCPITVQWLLENYETAEGVSLPRSTLYYHYLRHCNEHKLDRVNAASFGKLIRSVFLGLRTRRLGTRGNSKYHYYGIRLKPNSPLVNVTEESDPSFSSHSSPSHNTSGSQNGSPGTNHSSHNLNGDVTVGEGGTRSCTIIHNNNNNTNNNNNNIASGNVNNGVKRLKIAKGEHYEVSHNGSIGDSFTIQQYLGDPSCALENFPEIHVKIPLPEGLHVDDLLIFRSLYREHCESLLDTLSTFQLSQVESYWRTFWRSGSSPHNNVHHISEPHEYEKMLPKEKLHLLCTMVEVQEFVRDTDYQFYQNIVGILLPDVLRPIPSSMTQAIRNFAKTLETWLTAAMSGYPAEMVSVKVLVVNALAQTLRRYTSLNHLAQAARAVLQNQNQITQMLSDLNRVDFHNVEEQASWVCGCDGEMVPSLEQDFKATLAQQQTLEQWANWLEGVVDRVLRPHLTSPRFVQAARHFLLKWSFYSSLVIRDLTLRSAASFGSFHLLRLLYDEYMFYLVENRVARVLGVPSIAVIGQKKTFDGLAFDPSISHSLQGVEENPGSEAEYTTHHNNSSGVSVGQSANSTIMCNNGHDNNSPMNCSSSPTSTSSVDIPSPSGSTGTVSCSSPATATVSFPVQSTASVHHIQNHSEAGVVVVTTKAEIKRVNKNFLAV